METATIRVRPAMGGFVATLRGERCTAADHRDAALDLARRVYGDRVNVRADYLRPSDRIAGVHHRYHVTHLKGAY